MFCVSSWLYSGGFDHGIPACLPPPPRRATSRTATAGAPPELGVGCPASPLSRNGLQVRVQTLWQTGRTHWQTGSFGMLVTSTSWNWGEAEVELLKGDTVVGGGRVEESPKKSNSPYGGRTPTRGTPRKCGVLEDSQDARPLERGPRERRNDARERVTAETEEGHRLGTGSAAEPLRAPQAPKRCTAGQVSPVSSKPD
ncbi:hypothetical protein HPB47_027645 [Ixodes persulcatus]|uniref:Uncharacterized protein n=1 Tax=Ixodes persulcatus TaxID=34615 RepID=A0AC60PWW4_IXOPE|nr:hypothetical protein HPB47_027645 [Ixodes persulcatus]